MRRLTVSVPVAAPGPFTFAFLPSYFHGDTGRRELHELFLRYTLPNVAKGLSVDRNVSIETHQAKGGGSLSALDISWSVTDSSAFPRYSGTFTAPAVDARSCRLQLQGRYQAPGGIIGGLFDSIAGRHIAQATIAAFLAQIAHAAERDYGVRMAM
jgi:hypothetical protein